MKKFTLLTIILIFTLAFIGCETVPETNSNTAVVTNDNANAADANEVAEEDGDSWDWNDVPEKREDFDKDKEKYEKAAKDKYEDDSIGDGANDLWLWTKTRASLATIDDLRDSTINVDVENEVVTLKGTVESDAGKKAAEEAAKKIEGVKEVKSELKVDKGDSMTNQAVSDDDEDEDKPAANK